MMNALTRGVEIDRVGAGRAAVAGARLARLSLEGVHVRSGQHRPHARRVGSQRSAQHLQAPLVHQRHRAHRDRRLLPLRRRSCRSRPWTPTASSTLRLGYRIRPGWDLSLIGTNLLHDRHVEFRAGTAPETYERVGDACDRYGASDHARASAVAASSRPSCAWLAGAAAVRAAQRRRRSKPTSRPCSSSTSASTSRGRRSPSANARPAERADLRHRQRRVLRAAEVRGAGRGRSTASRCVPVALEGLDEAKTCQILYVGDAQTPDAKAWLARGARPAGADRRRRPAQRRHRDRVRARRQPHPLRHQSRVGRAGAASTSAPSCCASRGR